MKYVIAFLVKFVYWFVMFALVMALVPVAAAFIAWNLALLNFNPEVVYLLARIDLFVSAGIAFSFARSEEGIEFANEVIEQFKTRK